MLTLTNNVAAKFAVATVAVAMMFSAVAPANAQSVDDMSLDELLALVTQLQAELTQSDSSTGGSMTTGCYTFTRDLTMGATGADVMELQKFLMAAGQSIPAGPTDYFGGQTQAALASWQAANGVSPAVGYFGPITRSAVAAKCVPMTDGGDDATEEEEEDEDDSSMTLRGEGVLDDVTIDSASDDEIEEGAEDAEIAEVTFEAVDGDIEISRLDIVIDNSGVDMWDVLDTVSLWIDGDMVAEMDASDEDDYQSDEETLRFSGLDIFAEEDEELDMVIAVTLQNNLDNDDLSATSGNFSVSVDSVRYFDADGVAETDSTTGELGTDVTFTVKEAGADDEIIVKTSSSDPDAATLKVEDDSKSDWYTVFVFDLDTDDSVNDIEFNEVTVTLNTSIAYSTLVDDVEIVIDGTTIDDVTVKAASSTATSTVLVFDVDGDVVVDAGDRVEAELMVRFKSLAPANEGATVQGLVTGTNADDIDAEGADDLAASQLSGAATGDTHTLRTTGIEVEAGSMSAVVTTSDGALNDYATFEIEVDVTAFDQDVFIPIASASTSWNLTDSAGNVLTVPAASTSVVITSTADEGGASNAFFEINEGETETVTITVTYTPSIASTAARLQLNSLVFDETGTVTGADDQTWTATPSTDYRTSVVTIVN